jgi:hypothetical protein
MASLEVSDIATYSASMIDNAMVDFFFEAQVTAPGLPGIHSLTSFCGYQCSYRLHRNPLAIDSRCQELPRNFGR